MGGDVIAPPPQCAQLMTGGLDAAGCSFIADLAGVGRAQN